MSLLSSSRKQHYLMAPKTTTTIFNFFFFLLLLLQSVFMSHQYTPSLLKVPPSEFTASVREAIDALHDVASTLESDFFFSSKNNNNGFVDSRLTSAVSACLELMELSLDELSWAVSAIDSPKPKGKHYSTGNLNSDLRTWLSSALANTDTCVEGFEGTTIGNVKKGLISNSIEKVNSLVQQLLKQVHPVSVHNNDLISTKQSHQLFPPWVEAEDQLRRRRVRADAVVAADGSGNYTRVMDAVLGAPEYRMKRYVIHIRKGVYEENVVIGKKKWYLMMIGDGMDATVITGNLSYAQNITTFKTATFAVNAMGFIARDMSFRNTAGPENHQAVALRTHSDLSVFYRCGIFGYQDSLYAHASRQFYRECTITGTVDFIFGHADAVFQNCTILAKKGLPTQKNTITAQAGKDSDGTPSGFSIQFCNISADFDLLPSLNSTQTYLGRPWKPYSRTVFMQSYISDVLMPKGWLAWNDSLYLDTLYFGEFMNYGPGAGVAKRVKWSGYHVMNDSSQASNFTVSNLILGDIWLPSTGVTFNPGL